MKELMSSLLVNSLRSFRIHLLIRHSIVIKFKDGPVPWPMPGVCSFIEQVFCNDLQTVFRLIITSRMQQGLKRDSMATDPRGKGQIAE
jgi:hypothetical protein